MKRKEFWRNGLIDVYQSQLEDSGPFMKIVLIEAIRKLKETELSPKKIEKWVIKIEDTWRNI